ncbi:MAG TPA: hypothetical protein VMT20_21550 [Terriglobia bacterium]|nr:hypothetical protein [Terriglobia bacterium]
MKAKHFALGVTVIAMAISGNAFGDSLTLSGSSLQVTSVNGLSITGGSLSFSDPTYLGNWQWGSGGTLSLTGTVSAASASGTLLSDDFQSATVLDISGTSYQLTFGAISGTFNSALASFLGVSSTFTNGALVLILSDPALPAVGAAFTASNLSGGIQAGGTGWVIGSAGTVSAAAPTAMDEPWSLSTSLVFYGMMVVFFWALARAKILIPLR